MRAGVVCDFTDDRISMNRKGFTLIEVVVVMAIVATLAGIMIPFIYKVWESNEIDTTRERMIDIKKAMVGDPKLVQNGVRTNFGFVGDNGQLPASLDDLLADPVGMGFYHTWKGPYMPSGYDSAKFDKDAWGNDLIYAPVLTGGRRLSATLKSKGPDGQLNTSDDISDSDLQISDNEVAPTDVVQGNINVVVVSGVDDSTGPTYSAKLTVKYSDITNLFTGKTSINSGCIQISIGPLFANIPKSLSPHFSTQLGSKPPVGKVTLSGTLYSDSNCTTAFVPALTTEFAVFIPNDINAISVNLSTINYRIP